MGGEGSQSTVPSLSSITTHSCKGYVVRKPNIMRALHWLKTSNILYGDIHIADSNITCDDSVASRHFAERGKLWPGSSSYVV